MIFHPSSAGWLRLNRRQVVQPQRLSQQGLHLRNKRLKIGHRDMGIEGILPLPRLAHIEGVRRVAQLKQGVVEIARLLSCRQEQRLQGLAQGIRLAGLL